MDIALAGLILIFLLALIWVVFTFMVGGYVEPLTQSLNPNLTEGHGITATQYSDTASKLKLGGTIFFFIIIGGAILFIIVKAFFNREQVSAPF